MFKVGDQISIDFNSGKWGNDCYYGMIKKTMSAVNVYKVIDILRESLHCIDRFGMDWYIPKDTVIENNDNVDWNTTLDWTLRNYPIIHEEESEEL